MKNCPNCGSGNYPKRTHCFECGSELAAPQGSPPITAAEFESGCNNAINGWLWDESYSLRYSEPVSLGISEMRYIANLIRSAQGRQPGVVREFSEDAANDQAQRAPD